MEKKLDFQQKIYFWGNWPNWTPSVSVSGFCLTALFLPVALSPGQKQKSWQRVDDLINIIFVTILFSCDLRYRIFGQLMKDSRGWTEGNLSDF